MTDSEYKACGYHVRLNFVAEHGKGHMKGVCRNDSLPFCTESDAMRWVANVNANYRSRRDAWAYRVTSPVVTYL